MSSQRMKLNMFKLVLLSILGAAFASENGPEVKIEQGTLRGTFRNTWKGRRFYSFSGIPYAEPPVGDLRFERSVPAKPWIGVLDATKLGPICPQMNVFFGETTTQGSEDCLYLNVYTPQLPEDKKDLLPAVFFIHAGGWMYGSGDTDLYGPDLLLDKDVILVTHNYRLGALGFLSTGDTVVPGNNALKDQNLALKWAKKNIAHFGGDPDKITLFGQSAGAASTHHHFLSPLSKDLIHGAISDSGIATATWAVSQKGENQANGRKLAQWLDCPTTSSQEMVDCLRKVDAADIVKQDLKLMEWGTDPIIPFKPVIEPNIEGAFLVEDPIDIIKAGKAAHMPFLTGFNTQDGALRSTALYNNSKLVLDLDRDFNKYASMIFMYDKTSADVNAVGEKLREFYLGDKKIDDSTKDEITDMITDGYFAFPQSVAVKLHAKYSKQPVYFYLFGYRGTKTFAPIFGDPTYDYGVCHGDELLYLFSMEIMGEYKPNETEKKMVDVMTTLWTNFARTGNPTPETDALVPTKWEPAQEVPLGYYSIMGPSDMGMKKGLHTDRMQIWKNLPTSSRIKDEL